MYQPKMTDSDDADDDDTDVGTRRCSAIRQITANFLANTALTRRTPATTNKIEKNGSRATSAEPLKWTKTKQAVNFHVVMLARSCFD